MSYAAPESAIPAIDREAATDIVRRCLKDPRLSVMARRPLSGGMINRVEEWQLSAAPHVVVAKMNHGPDDMAGLRQEELSLRWCRRETRLPVPEVYGLVDSHADRQVVACLLLQRLAGRNLNQATLTCEGRLSLCRQMALHLGHLHQARRATYGHISEAGQSSWIDWFAPRLQANYVAARPQLSADEARLVERILADLPSWLAGASQPAAVHGDIWGANLIVDDADPNAPTLVGFIDGGGLFADVDYELAYIGCFSSNGWEEFYRAYAQSHPLRPGYERRWRVYWLNTILLHVWMFGAEYLPRCREVLGEIPRFAP